MHGSTRKAMHEKHKDAHLHAGQHGEGPVDAAQAAAIVEME